MQAQISASFKPRAIFKSEDASCACVGTNAGAVVREDEGRMDYEVCCKSPERNGESPTVPNPGLIDAPSFSSRKLLSSGVTALNRKRAHSQYHLELGQPDFLLHSCSTCGFKYACGDLVDEKVHTEFHKNFCQGIRFKGWCGERVVFLAKSDGERIILVLNGVSFHFEPEDCRYACC